MRTCGDRTVIFTTSPLVPLVSTRLYEETSRRSNRHRDLSCSPIGGGVERHVDAPDVVRVERLLERRADLHGPGDAHPLAAVRPDPPIEARVRPRRGP